MKPLYRDYVVTYWRGPLARILNRQPRRVLVIATSPIHAIQRAPRRYGLPPRFSIRYDDYIAPRQS